MSEQLSWSSLLTVPIGVYIGLLGYLFFFQNQQVFHPTKGLHSTPDQWRMVYEPVTLDSDGVPLRGWWIPGDETKPVLLFFHGNASTIADLQPFMMLFQRLGLSILAFDYRGYGESEGTPTEAGTEADADAAWRYLTEVRGINSERLIYYGHSLGGGIATGLAERHAPGFLILEGTFTSIPDAAADHYPYLPVRWMARIRYDSFRRIQGLKVPVMVIHSPDDEVIPFQHGRKLFAAAREPKWFVESRGAHNEGLPYLGEEAVEVMEKFLKGERF